MLMVRTPSPADLHRLLVDARAAEPAYPEVGATAEGLLPSGYKHDRYSVLLGRNDRAFERGVAGLKQWEPMRRAGLSMHPPNATVAEGETLLLVMRVRPLIAIAVNRIVWTLDQPDAVGFAYGTLPGHDERGEEAFLVRHHADGRVTFDVVAFSKPVGLARMGSPLTRAIQRRTTHRYLSGLEAFVDEGAES